MATDMEKRSTTTVAQIVGKTMKNYKQQMILNGHTKAELQSWDIQMREGLGDNAEYHPPRQLRAQRHVGRLKTKRTEGQTLSVNQLHEYQLAVKK